MLSSYRILDLTNEKGLFCGALLGRMGADVIAVEKPGGSPARNVEPFLNDANSESSLFWLAYSVNKRSITLDIEKIDGREIFKKLVRTTDVVIESFEPGFMDELGLGYSELSKINPGIILTSITPFGQDGPYVESKYKASDLVCWALGGLLFSSGSTGRGPVRISHSCQAFLIASSDAAWGTAMAIYWRGISGEGQHVDVSMQESVNKTAQFQYTDWKVTGELIRTDGSNYVIPPMRTISRSQWLLKDGHYIQFSVTGGIMARRTVMPVVKWMIDEEVADNVLTRLDWENTTFELLPEEEKEKIYEAFEKFFRTKNQAEVVSAMNKRQIMIEIMWTPREVLDHPQLKFRGYWQQLKHENLGITLTYPGALYQSAETHCKLERRAPMIGEHNREVYIEELGFAPDELAALKQGEVI